MVTQSQKSWFGSRPSLGLVAVTVLAGVFAFGQVGGSHWLSGAAQAQVAPGAGPALPVGVVPETPLQVIDPVCPDLPRAAVDYFLKIEGIDGESTVAGFEGAIEIESFSWGATNTGNAAASGGGAGKVNLQDFHFVMRNGKASPELMKKLFSGQRIPQAVLTVRDPGNSLRNRHTIRFEEVIVTSISTTGSPSSEYPIETVSLNFNSVEFGVGPDKATYNIKAAKRQ